MATTHPAVRLLQIVASALLGSLVAAMWFVCVFHWSLPPDDGAYGQPPFASGFVVQFMFVGALVSWVAVCPFALALLWRADLRRSVPIVVAVALVAITGITPFASLRAWPASVAITVLAMLVCRWRFRESGGAAAAPRAM